MYTADRNIPPTITLAYTTLPAFMLAACLLFLHTVVRVESVIINGTPSKRAQHL
jgi:hypothetical protein